MGWGGGHKACKIPLDCRLKMLGFFSVFEKRHRYINFEENRTFEIWTRGKYRQRGVEISRKYLDYHSVMWMSQENL